MMVREERKSDAHSYLVYMVTYTTQLCLVVLVLTAASIARLQKFSSILLAFGLALLSDIALKIILTAKYQKEINPTKRTKLKSWVEIISGVKDLVLLLFLVDSADGRP
jgi:multisubunit Na+/H+ antiporter MnhG subunit